MNYAFDLSIGQAIRPFKTAAQWAVNNSLPSLHCYDDYGRRGRKTMADVCDFITKELGVVLGGWRGIPSSNVVQTVGVTGAIDVTLQVLAMHVADYSQSISKKLQPTLIMPAPYYGMFEQNAERHGYKIITVERDPNKDWAINPTSLSSALSEIASTPGLHPTAFLDSNPNNPTGHVREQAEAANLAGIMADFNRAYVSSAKKPKRYWENVPYLSILDDMVYLRTEYGRHKPCSFAAIPESNPFTFLMLGLSKIGLASLRAGLVVVPEPFRSSRYLEEIVKIEKEKKYFSSEIVAQALKFCFSTQGKEQKTSARFVKRLSRDHAFNAKLMKALINGADDVCLTAAEKKKITNIVAASRKIEPREAERILAHGISGARVITTPQAGFFHLIDFSLLRGKYYSNEHHPSAHFYGAQKAVDEYAIQHVFSSFGLRFCSGTFTGFDKEQMIVRATYALPPAKIVEVCRRIQRGCKEFMTARTAKKHYRL